jgi:hypothetical protein
MCCGKASECWLERAHPRVPRPHPAPIPVRGSLAGALVSLSTDQAGNLRLDQRPGQGDAIPLA